MIEFNLREMADVAKSVDHFQSVHAQLIQLGSHGTPIQEGLKDYWSRRVMPHTKGKQMGWLEPGFETHLWRKCNIHIVIQNWGSTSCGWGGIGGAAMTDAYTTIVENNFFYIAGVYYGGKLAYLVEINDTYMEYKEAGFISMPGLDGLGKLKVLYRSK